MVLREHLEEQINKDYELLKKLEDRLRTESDPRNELRWTEDIKKVKQRIHEREEELRSLSASSVQPEPVTPYLSPPEPEQEVKPPTQTPLVENIPLQPQPRPSGFLSSKVARLSVLLGIIALGLAFVTEDNASFDGAHDKPLSEIPVTGDKASEVGADYTKLRDLLDNKEFGKADLETTRKILWVAKREEDGWLDVEDIVNFPSKDLRTINQLWLAASKGKFGFSVQKQIWLSCGGKPGQLQFDIDVFERFIEKVEWAENKAIFFDQRAARGHLPMGMSVILEHKYISHHQLRWWGKIDQVQKTEQEEHEEEMARLRGEVERLSLLLEKMVKVSGSNDHPVQNEHPVELESRYFHFLSRKDL